MPSHYRCVLLDVDGTLIDSEAFNRGLLRETLRSFGLHYPDSALDALCGRTIRHCYEVLAPDIPFDQCFAVQRALEEERNHTIRAFEDAHEVLPVLEANGILLGAFSSRRRDSLLEIFAHTTIGMHFDTSFVLGFEDVALPKPDPEGITRLLRAHDVDIWEAVYVGDTHIDVRAAHAAGIASAIVVRDGDVPNEVAALTPEYLMHDLFPLLSLCGIARN